MRRGHALKAFLPSLLVTRGPPPWHFPFIDVWAVGCIFGEMLGRKPLFPGNDYIHQLKLITKLVGTPSAEVRTDNNSRFFNIFVLLCLLNHFSGLMVWPRRRHSIAPPPLPMHWTPDLNPFRPQELAFVTNHKARRFMLNLPKEPQSSLPSNLKSKYPDASPEALSLLRKMLVIDPAKRITVAEALEQPYLASLHDPVVETMADSGGKDWRKDGLRSRGCTLIAYNRGGGGVFAANYLCHAARALPLREVVRHTEMLPSNTSQTCTGGILRAAS